MGENELSLLGRLARWLESHGAVVRSTNFSYEDDRAVLTAVIDMKGSDVLPREGADELRKLEDRAETVYKLPHPSLPSTLEVMALSMAASVLRLREVARRRAEDYYFYLFKLLEEERKRHDE